LQVKLHHWCHSHRWQICHRWQFATGVVETGGKFAAGIVDTSGKQWEQYQAADTWK
jgi:hypothetical protein